MINFRYHIVSLIAVFLALAIGVIMGSAVIDRAIVGRLEDQQRSLENRLGDIEHENDALRSDNRELRDTDEKLAEQGSQRLLAGTLAGVPVALIATRGVESSGFDDLLSLLGTSGAARRGTIWLTDRFELASDDERRDLAAALDAPESMSSAGLRTLALNRLAAFIRAGAGTVVDDPSVTTTTTAPSTPTVFASLRDAGFVDFDAPEGQLDDDPILTPGTRLVLVSGAAASVPVDEVAVPFTKLLMVDRPGVPSVALLAAEDRPAGEREGEPEFTVALRQDDEVAGKISTVDNIGDFAGRLASVLAIVDLGAGRLGQYGRGPGAQRLLPAPPEP